MEKGCSNFQLSSELDVERNSYYYTEILNLDAMEKNSFNFDKVDVCNCCEKDNSCDNAKITRNSFINEYFAKFF